MSTYHFFFFPPSAGHIAGILPLSGPVSDIFRQVSNIPLLCILPLFIYQRSTDNCRGNLMEVKKLAVYGFVAFAVLALAMPAGAWLGPFGGCGLGLVSVASGGLAGLGLGLGCGLGFGPFGPFGPLCPFSPCRACARCLCRRLPAPLPVGPALGGVASQVDGIRGNPATRQKIGRRVSHAAFFYAAADMRRIS